MRPALNIMFYDKWPKLAPAYDRAMAALRELKIAGFDAELLGEMDDYSTTTFLGVRYDGPNSDIWEEVKAIVEPFYGKVDGPSHAQMAGEFE